MPQEIYTQPASRFVADVTGANFIPAFRQGQFWATEVGCFAALDDDQEQVELMIREEDLRLELAQTDAPAVIHSRRFLGREYRYCLLTPSGKELHARTSTSQMLPVGAKVKLNGASVKIFPQGDRAHN